MPTFPVPPVWAIILGILAVFFGGTYGIVWMVRKEIRESRLQPGVEKAQQLEAQRAAAEIAAMLGEAQREAMADMRQMLADVRAELATAKRDSTAAAEEANTARRDAVQAAEEAHTARTESRLLRIKIDELEKARQDDRDEHDRFRGRVERLLAELRADGVELPAWWVAGA